jgi:hypothetical protein
MGGIVVTDSSRILRSFNAHLRDKCVVVADEAFFPGDRRNEGTLKGLITGSTLTIEPKGYDLIISPNYVRLIILSNNEWVVPTSIDERRYLVVRCGAEHKKDTAYFKAIHDELHNGGYQALLYHLLCEVDLTGFEVRTAPHTKELDEQTMHSLRGFEAAWYDCLVAGWIPGQVNQDEGAWLYAYDFLEWAAKRNKYDVFKAEHLGRLFDPSNLKAMGFRKNQVVINKKRMMIREIPKLSAARKRWDEARFPGVWNCDAGWESDDWVSDPQWEQFRKW